MNTYELEIEKVRKEQRDGLLNGINDAIAALEKIKQLASMSHKDDELGKVYELAAAAYWTARARESFDELCEQRVRLIQQWVDHTKEQAQ